MENSCFGFAKENRYIESRWDMLAISDFYISSIIIHIHVWIFKFVKSAEFYGPSISSVKL